jgi:hypothetical protein
MFFMFKDDFFWHNLSRGGISQQARQAYRLSIVLLSAKLRQTTCHNPELNKRKDVRIHDVTKFSFLG